MINQKSIAVLPFNNISGDPDNQYFADGISEEIINTLCKIKGLKVTARTSSFSYRDRQVDVRHIGNDLGVSTVLEGSIRRAANRVRISTQLIRTDTGFHIWSESFDRELTDIFNLQDEISRLIADRIREQFGHFDIQDDFETPKTSETRAYQAYLKGRFFLLQWTVESIQKAQESFKESISLDPEYPLPYLGLSQSFVHQAAWNLADRMKALYMAHHFIKKLGDKHTELAEYHYTKGLYHFIGNWDFEKAQSHLNQALRINSNFSDALEFKAELLNANGHFDEAKQSIDRAIELNPNSPNHFYILAWNHYLQEQYKEAITSIDKGLSINDGWEMALELKAICQIQQNEENEFILTTKQFASDKRETLLHLWKAIKEGEQSDLSLNESSTFHLPVCTYLAWYGGTKDKAIELLINAFYDKSGQHINFRFDPLLAPLRQTDEVKKLKFTYSLASVNSLHEEIKESKSETLSEEEVTNYLELLNSSMSKDLLYLDSHLSLRELAIKLNLHPNKLSWLLNNRIGKGFNEFINQHRLAHFKKIALKPEVQHLSILGIAYESGFNSKSVFNEFFKKNTGTTPKAWVKLQTSKQAF
ncbi:MAG: helix-turn-helix domain-containing protein [Roseivirga sp.]|uniref:helix-turn-helix domain-containing protein n=1 Tax=Roseivirga sp. TaxID=1964215 RepID=UPI001B1EF41B|nr:helix-turn-helix domain-containing protein [Roseivirga sp.]MBO6659280.1 helix-turn-helix domain-containing protein [Roseivirga sp.]MBO6761747.1 helix-turn-helix domain-containing protein [Roseivirga sp.]MBO6907983.1 helix-turn-helix domain-containing protein [Roseivirga sp.]